MDINRFTERGRGLLEAARSLARRESHQHLTPEHLLKILIDDDDKEGLAANLISSAGGDPAVVKQGVDQVVARLPKVEGMGEILLAQETARVLEKAQVLADKWGDSFVALEAVLQALALVKGTPAARVLSEAGATLPGFEQAITAMRQGRTADSATAESRYDSLRKYTRDLTVAARDGKLDPVVGRDEEIRRTIQILSRRTKNNPVLIGEPGVGKTAIVEGLAQRIVNGDVPESLRERQLLVLDLGAMLAGSKFRGEFEQRLKSVLQDINAAAGEIVVFIDELHTLVGAGAAEGAMDASNMLKPALARGDLHCVGATTLDEYRERIEKDAALARRFQPLFVSEPTVNDTVSILRGLNEKYELHHGVRITDGALVAAAILSNRYISDRFLPDKAIDLVDEAASRLRMEVDSKPEEIDELDRRIIRLKIEREALKKESDKASQTRLAKLEKELVDLEKSSADLTTVWRVEKLKLAGAQKIKEELDRARQELAVAQRDGKLERAGELTYGVMPELERRLVDAEADDGQRMLNEAVTDEDIAAVVSRWTGVPIDKMMEGEREKLLAMERHLRTRVVGQDQAITAISNAVRRARAGLQDLNRPVGSFMFLGPTGVGKTELTKALAAFLFEDEQAMVRIDMSEYMEKHAVARLIGAPPGYVGYESGGSLTESVRRRPYQVVLFDEVEKAHPDIFNVLLQVLDDGRLTDSHGRTVDFRNTLIVLTSNLGSETLADQCEDEVVDTVRAQVMDAVRATFRPEFLNRLDEILLFHRLSRDHMALVVDIQLARLKALMADRHLTLEVDHAAKAWLAKTGYEPVYGARSLKRVMQRALKNPLAGMILEGEIADGDVVRVSVGAENLAINAEAAEAA